MLSISVKYFSSISELTEPLVSMMQVMWAAAWREMPGLPNIGRRLFCRLNVTRWLPMCWPM